LPIASKAADGESIVNEAEKHTGRSIRAVVAGFLVVVALSIGTDEIPAKCSPALGQRMSDDLLVLATVYRTIYGILGSFVTARLAPHKPMKHALIAAAIGTVIATAGAVATWNKDLGPHWYAIVLILTAFPTAWIGAKMRLAQLRKA